MEEERAEHWLASDDEWEPLAKTLLAKLRTTGSVVHRTRVQETSLGAFYEERARRGAALVITLDALFALVHASFASLAADVETSGMTAELGTMLHRLDARLGAEAPHARPDLLEGYRLARTVVAVALSLLEPGYVVPAELAEVAVSETALVRGHPGLVTSPLLGVPIDYGAFAPRGPIASPADPRAGIFQAAEWLGDAPFSFVGRGEDGGVAIDVGMARVQARAALLIARLLQKDTDAPAATAFARMTRTDRFVLGEGDDLSPRNVTDLAKRVGMDLNGGDDVVDTSKVDRFRHAAARTSLARASRRSGDAGGETAGLGESTTMRVVPLRAPPDGRVLQRLVTPFIGALAEGVVASLQRERALPSALDVGAWLGSEVARSALVARGDFGYAGFESALASLTEERPTEESRRHASVYASLLSTLSLWIRPSLGSNPELLSDDRRKLRTALVAWTFLRHDALPFAHDAPQRRPSPSPRANPERRAVRVFIEPHPEAIASLLGTIRQLHVGLAALGALPEDALSSAVATEVEGILALALEAAAREANMDPRLAELDSELAEIPARLTAVEAWTGAAADPVVVDVHFDAVTGTVLEEATAPIEELFLRVRDPATHRSVLAVGATIPHAEFLASAASPLHDAEWRRRLREGHAPETDEAPEPDRVPAE
jgi:hypothetical protein